MTAEASAQVQSLGSYELRRKLGAGGMAEVHLAVQRMAGGVQRLVVIKSILPALAADSRFVDMFLREARIAALLSHPNVVQIHDVTVIDARPCIVMEFLRGRDLAFALKRVARSGERVDPVAAAAIVAQAASGLHYAHFKHDERDRPLDLVHRDVSPHNLFITRDGHVRVLDFGVAKSARQREKTETGTVKGKLGYMAPEYLKGRPIDGRADLFALGVVLWESLTARRLFSRADHFQTMQALFYEEVVPPSRIVPSVPPELDAIAMRALARDPDERHASCEILAAALRAFLQSVGAPAEPQLIAEWLAEVVPLDEDELLYGGNFVDTTASHAIDPVEHTSTTTTTTPAGAAPSADAAPGARPGTVTVEPPLVAGPTEPVTRALRTPPGEPLEDVTPLPSRLPARRSRAWPIVAGGLVALALAGGASVTAWRWALAPSSSPPRATVPIATMPPVVEPPRTIEVRFAPVPEGARIEVDGQPIEGARYVGAPSARPHRVRVSLGQSSVERDEVFTESGTRALPAFLEPPPAIAPIARAPRPRPRPASAPVRGSTTLPSTTLMPLPP